MIGIRGAQMFSDGSFPPSEGAVLFLFSYYPRGLYGGSMRIRGGAELCGCFLETFSKLEMIQYSFMYIAACSCFH